MYKTILNKYMNIIYNIGTYVNNITYANIFFLSFLSFFINTTFKGEDIFYGFNNTENNILYK